MGERFWRSFSLRVNKFELVSGFHLQVSSPLWAHADPVDVFRWVYSPVGLDSVFELMCMESVDEQPVDLQEWLAASQHDEPPLKYALPSSGNRLSKFFCRRIAATERPVEADKV